MSYQTIYDCVIYGESVSAAAAALRMTEQNKKVLAVSPSGYLGGEIAVSFLPCLTKGVCRAADMLADNLSQANALHSGRADSAAFQIRVLKMLKGKADILFYERAAGIIQENGVMQGLVLAGKDGISAVRAKSFIDASDTLEVCRLVSQEACSAPRGDSVFRMKFRLLDGAEKTPEKFSGKISENIFAENSCWEPEKIIAVRSGSLMSVIPAVAELKNAFPELRDSIMTMCAFRGCRLNRAFLRGELPLRNLFAADTPESFTFEEHSRLAAARMKDGETLADKALSVMNHIPAPRFSNDRICVGESEEISCDVLVCGGGTAGALAAVAAARNGAKTVIWEAMDYLGGVGTGGALNGYYYGLPGGMQDEADARVKECEKILYGRHANHKPFFFTRFHPAAKMIVLQQMAEEAGVKIEYGKTVFAAETSVSNPRNLPDVKHVSDTPRKPVRTLEVAESASENGIVRGRAKVFIDSTGDGDLSVFAGARYTAGREPDGIQHIFSIPAIYLAVGCDKDENGNAVNTYRLDAPINLDAGYCDACDPWDVSRGPIIGILGFDCEKYNEDGHVLFCSAVLGARASRQIQGDYKLGLGDQIRAAQFPDLIAYSASHYDNHAKDYENESEQAMLWTWALDSHNEPIGCEIPFRTMLPEGIENLITACRAMSLDFDANLQFRMQRDMQRIGEAAGIAAAEAVKQGVPPRYVNIRAVQDKLALTHALECPEKNYHSVSWHPEGFHPENRFLDLTENGYRPAKNLLPAAQDAFRRLELDLDSGNHGVKYCAALKLAAVQHSEKALALLEQCIRERCEEFPPKGWKFRSAPCWKIAIAVCGAAGYVQARKAIEDVLQDSRNYKDPQVLILQTRALLKIGDSRSADIVAELLTHDEIEHTQEFHRWSANDAVFTDDCRWKLDLAAYETMYRLGQVHPEIPDKYRNDERGYVRQAVKRVENRLACRS